ncbi:MAG: amidohydrolase family protein, partial [Acidobacteriota bacterium]|nr:amidohydrolase family protein [Acidobacteriota bacterium]
MKKALRKISLAFIWTLVLVSFVSAQNRAIVIKNALVIDGSGQKAFRADVRFKDAKIVKIGSIKPKTDDEIIDANGKILVPGFIDIHNHSESGLPAEGTAVNQVSQGITTIAVGPDGGSPFPLNEYFAKLEGKVAPNVLSFIGHAAGRERVLGNDYKRRATDEEIEKMVLLVEQAMKEGAFGLSSGLEYDVGFSASTQELIALSRVAAEYKGIYMTHMRDEEEGMLDA